MKRRIFEGRGVESSRFRKSLLAVTVGCALMGITSTSAIAGFILPSPDGWNQGNVVTTDVLNADGDGFSYIYDQDPANSGASTSAYIKFTPDETDTPGLKVENNAPPKDGNSTYSGSDVHNCILSAGPSTCNGPFQSGKRFKFDATGFEPVDLVFNVDVDPAGSFDTVPGTDIDEIYKVFQKYGNATGERIGSFSVELGFGIGENFVASSLGDGLGFKSFVDPAPNEFSALFAAGLFGEGGTDEHPLEGYFDNNRSGFNLELVSEDFFKSAGMFGAYESLFGDWLPYSGTPQGFLYDDDGDPLTDAILVANQEEDGTWSVARGIDGTTGEVYTLTTPETGLTSIEAVLDFLDLNRKFCTSDAVCYEDAIEDLAKFNLTYFLDAIAFEPDSTTGEYTPNLAIAYGEDTPTFTLRITANEVPTAGVLPMLGLGLLGMLAARRRSGARVQG